MTVLVQLTKAKLEARLSAVTVQRCLDDDQDGTPDDNTVTQCLTDASSWLRGKLGPFYDSDALDSALAPEVERIGLDVATAYLCERHEEVMRRDPERLWKRAIDDIKEIRAQLADLGTRAAPTPVASRALVSSDSPRWPEDC